MGLNITCPHCQQNLLKATPSEDNHIRCSACGRFFEVALAVVTPPKLSAGEMQSPPPATATAGAAVAAEPVAKPKAPPLLLGLEPAPASYGFLKALAWAMLAGALVTAGYKLYQQYLFPELVVPDPFAPPDLPYQEWIQLGLSSLTSIFAAGVLVVLFNRIERFDRSASWLAWRSGSIDKPIAHPPGSSLPFLLPLCAAGGVLAMAGMAQALRPDREASPLDELTDGLSMLWSGGLIFLTGLACGELRRFFWRMGETAKRLVHRTRGSETSLGEPLNASKYLKHSKAYRYGMWALLMLLLPFVAWGLIIVVPWIAVFDAQRVDQNLALLQVLGVTVALFLGIVGGAYTLVRLSRLWSEMLFQWERAASTVRGPRNLKAGLAATRRFRSMIRIVAWLCIASLLVTLLTIAHALKPIAILIALGGACTVFTLLILFWLGALKQDLSVFVTAAGTLAVRRRVKRGFTPGTKNLSFGLLFSLFLHLALFGWLAYSMVDFLIYKKTFYSFLEISSRWGVIAYSLGILVITESLVLFPYYFLALLLRDADRATNYLESAGEAA